MSILDDDLDISQDVLIKARLVDLIHQSSYSLASNVTISNLLYNEPSKKIKYKKRYNLAITHTSRYAGNGNYETMYCVKWVHQDDYTPYYIVRINRCTIDLDEFEKNKGYYFEFFKKKTPIC